MKHNSHTLSVVMCTYNGASHHLAEQLDSIFAQTLLPDEIIVQDDCSNDNTMSLLTEYADKVPEGVEFLIFRNTIQKGINDNFFSAMRRARSEFIAVCDQDDIWMPDKLERQMKAIGDRMMCVCRSRPFAEQGASVRFDTRKPCCNLVRLFYASMPGHCQLLRSSLLQYIPTREELPEIYHRTCYDVMTATTAAALDSIVLIDEVLVKQRRYEKAATYVTTDNHRVRKADNALYMVWFGLCHFRSIKPLMNAHFKARLDFLHALWQREQRLGLEAKTGCSTRNEIFENGEHLLYHESQRGLKALWGIWQGYIKYRHNLFYTYEKDPVAFIRAIVHPFIQIYNYSYLKDKK